MMSFVDYVMGVIQDNEPPKVCKTCLHETSDGYKLENTCATVGLWCRKALEECLQKAT